MSNTIGYDLLPNLPGFKPVYRPNTSKKQTFQKIDGLNFVREELPPLIGLEEDSTTTLLVGSLGSPSRISTAKSTLRPMTTSQDPEITLTFKAYVEEVTLHTRLEEYRIRKCNIYFYPESGALMIVEKTQQNSGMAQGTILKRTVANKEDGSPFIDDDFRIGSAVNIFGRIYQIYDCDKRTREYLQDYSPAITPPSDAYEQHRMELHSSRSGWGAHHSKKNTLKTFVEAKLGNTVNNKGREGFLKYGNAVLKFLCTWDDTNSLYGDVMEYSLIYHLADDTIEIFSSTTNNSGREQFPRLLKRARLPKVLTSYSLDQDDVEPDFSRDNYHWTDFYIGCEISVYSRNLLIVDADQNTRNFYNEQNLELGQNEQMETNRPIRQIRQIPPHNGFGSEEDSLQSCIGPLSNTSSPKKKLGENKQLAFVADLLSGAPEDTERRFVITYYVTDSTIKVHEIPARNSGFVSGVFLSRRKLKGADNENITEKNLYVGATVVLQSHVFRLLQSNESTLRWMEIHRNSLPKSNIFMILDKLRRNSKLFEDARNGVLKNEFANSSTNNSKLADRDLLTKVLEKYNLTGAHPSQLTGHELITIVRHFGNRGDTFEFEKLEQELLEPSRDSYTS